MSREKNTRQFWKTIKSLRGKFGRKIRSIKSGNKQVTKKEPGMKIGFLTNGGKI